MMPLRGALAALALCGVSLLGCRGIVRDEPADAMCATTFSDAGGDRDTSVLDSLADTFAEVAPSSPDGAVAMVDSEVGSPDTPPDSVVDDATSACLTAVSLPIQACDVDQCEVVVRLDYDTHAVLGYLPYCEAPTLSLRGKDAALVVQAVLGSSSAPTETMDGFDFALFQRPTGATARGDGGIGLAAGGFAFVDHSGRVLIAGSIDETPSGGELIIPSPVASVGWALRPSTPGAASCAPASLPSASPVVPSGEAPIESDLVDKVIASAWNNAIGLSYAHLYGAAAAHFTAAVFRYAPTWRGTYRDWIVVVRLGRLPCASPP